MRQDQHLFYIENLSAPSRNHYLTLQEDSVFFFFFRPWHAQGFDEPEFLDFCRACFALRRSRPTLTLHALRALGYLGAATGRKPAAGIDYHSFAQNLDLGYAATAYLIGQLSEGRAGEPGLRLAVRLEGEGPRHRQVGLSRLGRAMLCRLTRRDGAMTDAEAVLTERILPALDFVTGQFPGLSLGGFCVLLYVTLHQDRFAYDGVGTGVLHTELGLRNLTRHLNVLGPAGHDVIATRPHDGDKRIRLPGLTPKGAEIMAQLASILAGQPAAIPYRIKSNTLRSLPSPADITALGPEERDPLLSEALRREAEGSA